jgi:hypothetical protein
MIGLLVAHAAGVAGADAWRRVAGEAVLVLDLPALLVQKYKY